MSPSPQDNFDRGLQQLLDDYWQYLLEENPDLAFEQGDERGRHCFYRQSLADIERQHAKLKEFAQALTELEAQGSALELSRRQNLNLALLDKSIGEALRAHELDEHLRPNYFPFAPDLFLSYCISATVLQSRSEAEDYLQRLRSIAPLFDGHIERLLSGIEAGYNLPSVLLERIAGSATAYLDADIETSIWWQPLNNYCGEKAEYTDLLAQARDIIENSVRPAYQRWLGCLRGDVAERGLRDSVGLCDQAKGKDYYRYLVKHHSGTDTSPEEMHRIGLEEVARLQAALEAVAAEDGYAGRLSEYREYLNSDSAHIAADADSLLRDIQVLAKQIDRKIPEFFGLLPRMSYGVELIPADQATRLPAAYAQPNPPTGVSPGIYWLNPLTERVPRHMHIPLTLHEAWPGHLMHVALIWEMDSVPSFARFKLTGYNAYAEGWALYCERLGEEMGFFDTPWKRFGALEMELFRAIRLVVDTGLHLYGWSRQQAIDYILEQQPQALSTVEAEVDRYIGMPAQALAYKMGELTITALRKRAEQSLGEQFRLRDFHDQILSSGPVTLTMLEQHIQSWLDQQQTI